MDWLGTYLIFVSTDISQFGFNAGSAGDAGSLTAVVVCFMNTFFFGNESCRLSIPKWLPASQA